MVAIISGVARFIDAQGEVITMSTPTGIINY
jgi:hypothetical protein